VILTTLNKDAAKINKAMIRNLHSELIVSVSVDRPYDSAEGAIAIEALNKVDVAGFPNYELELVKSLSTGISSQWLWHLP
jgi:hypothetical protein